MFLGPCKCQAGVLVIRFLSFWLGGNVPIQPTHTRYWATLVCVNQSSDLPMCRYVGSSLLCFWFKTVYIYIPRNVFTLLNNFLSSGCLCLSWQCWTRCWQMAVLIRSLSKRSKLLESLWVVAHCVTELGVLWGCTGLQVWVCVAVF